MATVVAPVEKRERPPAMSPNYPEPVRPTASHWKLSMEMMLPVPKASQTHIVVDGDTLAALAQRYLRSASRANEIFEANRDVLRDPALLPIGVELKIPQ
jgi:nucleoid-associated protein YgaU